MSDPSEYSDAEILSMAGIGGGATPDYSSYSDADILQMAGVPAQPEPSMWESIVGKGYQAPSGIGEALSNFGSNIFNKDVWFGRPDGEVIEPAQAIAGPLSKTLQGMTLGAGDEITAGGASVLDFLMNNPTTYDQRLEQARGVQQNFEQASPVVAGGMELAGALKMPVPTGIFSKTPGLKPALGNIAKAAGVGGGMAGLAGFGMSEGGFENRATNAIESAPIGALLGGGMGAIGETVSGLAGRYANKFADAADDTLEKGLGIQYGDKAKGLNKVNLYVDEAGEIVPFDKLDEAAGIQSPIQQQVKILEDAGIFANAPDDVQALKLHITKEGSEIGKTIPKLIARADNVVGKEDILPAFTNTEKFLEGYRPETKAKLLKEFNALIDDYIESPGTGLKKLTKFTDQLQKETDFNALSPRESTQLKRMVAFDMRKGAEETFDKAVPEMTGAFTKANEVFAATKTIGKTLNKPMARKNPSIGDYITGGSLPMTVTTGLLSAPLGFAPAALISGGRLAKNAVQQYLQAAKPISTARFYKNASKTLGKLGGEDATYLGKPFLNEAASPAESLRPSFKTGSGGSSLPAVSTAQSAPLSTVTTTKSPSYKYGPGISGSDVLSDVGFISHYNNTIKEAPALQKIMDDLAPKGSNTFSNIKTKGSAARKIADKNNGKKPGYSENDIQDLIRGTVKVKDVTEVNTMLQRAKLKHNVVGPIEDYFNNPSPLGYKGAAINVKTQGGAIGEIQFHTPESLAIKNVLHPLYEEGRSLPSGSKRALEIAEESRRQAAEVSKKYKRTPLVASSAKKAVPLISALTGGKKEDPIEKALTQAENKIAMKTPEIIEAKRVSTEDKDFGKLVKAVIKQESGGRANAVSPVGATGLMQIMPATAKDIAKEMGLKDYDLKDPKVNQQMGEYYLKKMLAAFDGDVKLALAAYNWGIGNVKKAIAKYGNSWEDIREKAPLETRGYVRNITKNYPV